MTPNNIYDDVMSLGYILKRIDDPSLNVTVEEYSNLLSETALKIKIIAREKIGLISKADYPLTFRKLQRLTN